MHALCADRRATRATKNCTASRELCGKRKEIAEGQSRCLVSAERVSLQNDRKKSRSLVVCPHAMRANFLGMTSRGRGAAMVLVGEGFGLFLNGGKSLGSRGSLF